MFSVGFKLIACVFVAHLTFNCGASVAESANLATLLDAAESHNPRLKGARENLRGSREVITEIKSAYKPTVFFESNVRISERDATLRQGNTDFSQSLSPQQYSLRLSQTLYNGGRKKAQFMGAQLQVQADKAAYKALVDNVQLDVLNDFVSLSAAKQELDLLKQTQFILRAFLTLTKERVRRGDSTSIEVSQVVSRMANNRADLSRSTSQITILAARIESSTGLLITDADLPTLDLTAFASGLNDIQRKARESSAGLDAASLNERISRVRLISESKSNRPTLSLNAAAIKSNNNGPTIDRDDQVSIGLRLTMPLYNGGRGSSDRRRAYSQIRVATLNRIEQERELDLRIMELWQNLLSQEAVIDAQKASLSAAQNAYLGVQQAQLSGLASAKDVLDALESKISAQMALKAADSNAARSRLMLLFLTDDLSFISADHLDLPQPVTTGDETYTLGITR